MRKTVLAEAGTPVQLEIGEIPARKAILYREIPLRWFINTSCKDLITLATDFLHAELFKKDSSKPILIRLEKYISFSVSQ